MPAALITGASGGFGRLIAARLAAADWHVFAGLRSSSARQPLDAAVAAAAADPARVTAVELDVTDGRSIAAAAAAVLRATGGRLDAVVPNAGVALVGAYEETPPDAVRQLIETNFFGVIETVRAVLPALRAAHGRIVLISSDCGISGAPALSVYTASKQAIEGWAESLHYELRPLGVSVSIVEPGAFATGIWASEVHGARDGPYAGFTPIAAAAWRSAGMSAAPADPVAATVLRALTARRPRLRYPVGSDARLMAAARRLVPHALVRAYVRRSTGIDRWRP